MILSPRRQWVTMSKVLSLFYFFHPSQKRNMWCFSHRTLNSEATPSCDTLTMLSLTETGNVLFLFLSVHFLFFLFYWFYFSSNDIVCSLHHVCHWSTRNCMPHPPAGRSSSVVATGDCKPPMLLRSATTAITLFLLFPFWLSFDACRETAGNPRQRLLATWNRFFFFIFRNVFKYILFWLETKLRNIWKDDAYVEA